MAEQSGTAPQPHADHPVDTMLAEFGIRVADPVAQVRIDLDRGDIRIGWVTIDPDGAITVVPCADTTPDQRVTLARHSLSVLLDGADPRVWRILPDGRWVGAVHQRIQFGTDRHQ